MRFSAGRTVIAGFVLSAFTPSPWIGAQTLQSRPPAQPEQPSTSAAPTTALTANEPVIPKGVSLQVEIVQHYPMKAGEAIEGKLLHPIYSDGKLVVPAQTPLRGEVVSLDPNRSVRWQGRLRGDFTPYHTPEVRFKELVLPGHRIPIYATIASDGAPLLHLTAPGVTPKKSFVAHYWSQAMERAHERVQFFTAPGLGDRALQMLYHQLPYHPERIEAHTAWSFELSAPVTLPDFAAGSGPEPAPPAQSPSHPETWAIQAEMTSDLTSATASAGDAVEALVVEPVYDRERQLVVPQGSTLIGKVTTAQAARSLGRNGKLRFTFQQVQMPAGATSEVEGALSGASVDKSQNLALDAEGTVTPRNQSSALAPLLLTMLAGRALDTDENMTINNGVASNGFGLVGRITGLVAGSPNLAAGLGYYAACLSFYDNFLHTGRDVVFPKDTRIEIETTPLRAPVLKANSQ